jgi:hypothetical protein
MPEINIIEYAEALHSRASEAILLKRAVIENGDWEPQANMCHHNVSMWCEQKTDYSPVRGWLYFDMPGLNYVRFVAHSAVRAPDGELYDITPSNAQQDYPFIESGLSEDEYAELVEDRGYGEIQHIITDP